LRTHKAAHMLKLLEHELNKMATPSAEDTQRSSHAILRTVYGMFRDGTYDPDNEVAVAICGGAPLEKDFVYKQQDVRTQGGEITLRQLSLSNFRCFKHLQVDFEEVDDPIYYLTGRMGAGKTTVLHAIKLALTGGAITKHKPHGTKTKPEAALSTADGYYTAENPYGRGVLRSAFLHPSNSRLTKPAAEITASIMQSVRCDELNKFLTFVKNIKSKLPKNKEADMSIADAIVYDLNRRHAEEYGERDDIMNQRSAKADEFKALESDLNAYRSVREMLAQIYDAYTSMWCVDESSAQASDVVPVLPPDVTESENLLIAALVAKASEESKLDADEVKFRDQVSEAVLDLIKSLRENVEIYKKHASAETLQGMYALCDSVRAYNTAHSSCAVCDTKFPDEASRDAASSKFADRLDSCVYSEATELVRMRMRIGDKYERITEALHSIGMRAADKCDAVGADLKVLTNTLQKYHGACFVLYKASNAAKEIRNAGEVDPLKVSIGLLLDTLVTTLIPAVLETLVLKDLEVVCQVVNGFYNKNLQGGMTLALYPVMTGTHKIDIKVKANGTSLAFEELSHGQQNVLCTLFDAAYLSVVDGDTRIIALDDTLTAVDMVTAAKVIKYIRSALKFSLILVPTQLTEMFLYNYGFIGSAGTKQVIIIKRETTQ